MTLLKTYLICMIGIFVFCAVGAFLVLLMEHITKVDINGKKY